MSPADHTATLPQLPTLPPSLPSLGETAAPLLPTAPPSVGEVVAPAMSTFAAPDGRGLAAPAPAPTNFAGTALVVADTGTPAPALPRLAPDPAAEAATPSSSLLMLDGEAPRLAAPTTTPALPVADLGAPAHTSTPDLTAEVEEQVDSDAAAQPVHPMAHLMPERTAPSEASLKAAQLRAAKKAKARKMKIGVAIGAVVVAAVVGPPLFRWVSGAINDAGGTSTEQPAD